MGCLYGPGSLIAMVRALGMEGRSRGLLGLQLGGVSSPHQVKSLCLVVARGSFGFISQDLGPRFRYSQQEVGEGLKPFILGLNRHYTAF